MINQTAYKKTSPVPSELKFLGSKIKFYGTDTNQPSVLLWVDSKVNDSKNIESHKKLDRNQIMTFSIEKQEVYKEILDNFDQV